MGIVGLWLPMNRRATKICKKTAVARPFMGRGRSRFDCSMRGLKPIRLPRYDYRTSGYYFVTVVSRNRENIFQNSKNVIEQKLEGVAKQIQGLSVDTKIVMPNHVHLILILENCALPLGEIIRRWKAKVSHTFGSSVWQPNYYDHVIRDEKALNRIREYIIYNPELEILKFERFYRGNADKSAGDKKGPINRRAT